MPALEALLRAPSQTIYHHRYLAADALAAIPGPAATAALVRALRDSIARSLDPASLESEDVIVNRVAEHLGHRASAGGGELAELLLDALQMRPYRQCVLALGRLGERRAIPRLIDCLHDDTVRSAAAEALRGLGDASIEPLIDTLLEPRLEHGLEPPSRIDGRVAAARLLGELAERSGAAPRVARALALGLLDGQRAVRVEAALSLARLARPAMPASDDAPTAAPIPTAAATPPVGVGSAAAPPVAAQVVRVLVAALDEPDWSRADTITQALMRLAPASEPPIVELVATAPVDEPDRRRRLRAVELTGRLRSGSAVPALASLSKARDAQLRLAATIALDAIPAADPASIERFLDDGEAAVRRRAVEALSGRRALPAELAVRLLGDPDSAVRAAAAASLRDNGSAALPALSRALRAFGASTHAPGSRWRRWWRAWRLLAAARSRAKSARD